MNVILQRLCWPVGALLALTGCLDPDSRLSITDAEFALSDGYYDTVDDSNNKSLRTTLHDLIDDHQRFPYSASTTDTFDIIDLADEDPNDPGRILDIYKNASYPKAGRGNDFYNREHVWPKSIGFPDDHSGNYPYTDLHHLFAADSRYNSARSNRHYDDCDTTCNERATVVNDLEGGGSGVYPGNSNWFDGSGTSGSFEVWHDRRGDAARALFYMDVRYQGGSHGLTGAQEPDLVLTDDVGLIVSGRDNRSQAFMGRLSTLLEWHRDDPVDQRERSRNDVIASFQGNRNPFIDHPEWVDCLFEDRCSGESKPPPPPPTVQANPWINEIHYDNGSTDVDEGVEIAGPAGLDLSGWSLVFYNGSSGKSYKTVALTGTIPSRDGESGGARWFAISGIQNGAPDAIALIAPSSGDQRVVQFLSYEGTLTAADGPAAGESARNIGVAETSSTPVGHSLQATGTGCAGDVFIWTAPKVSSIDAINDAQSIVCD